MGRAVRVGGSFSTGKRENLAAVGGEVELVEGAVRSDKRTHAATQGADCVIAALPSVTRSIQDPLTTNAVTITGMRSVGPAARDAGTRRGVFASSSSVYCRSRELPRAEELVRRADRRARADSLGVL